MILQTAYEKASGQYGRVDDAVRIIDPETGIIGGGNEAMALFESYERRIDKINRCFKQLRNCFHRRS